jgi:MoxR-like ATPase
MYDRVSRVASSLCTDLFERDEAVRLGLLVSLAGESMFLLGPPGVGKSLIARRLQMVFRDAKSFTYLMGRFSTPDEVFGPLSIRKLKEEDHYERVTEHYLPDADVVFLDEIWKASPPIQNALLTALNERLYRNGSEEIALPLKVFIGASNELPEDDEGTAAFWDRFLVRLELGPVTDVEAFADLVRDTADIYRDVVPAEDKFSTAEFRSLDEKTAGIAVPDAVMELILDIRTRLAANHAESVAQGQKGRVSDRRWKKITKLLRTSALLHGRPEVNTLDCAIIRHCVWDTREEQPDAERIVREVIESRAGRPGLLENARSRLGSLRARYQQESVEVIEEEAEVPATHRGEYYELQGDTDAAARGERVLVWHGDIDELAVGDTATMDLFRYDHEDQLAGSDSVEVTRQKGWELLVDGSRRTIQTVTRTVSRSRARAMPQDESAALKEAAGELVRDCASWTQELLAEADALRDQGHAHLFVPREYAELVATAILAAAEELARTRIEAEELLAVTQPGE